MALSHVLSLAGSQSAAQAHNAMELQETGVGHVYEHAERELDPDRT